MLKLIPMTKWFIIYSPLGIYYLIKIQNGMYYIFAISKFIRVCSFLLKYMSSIACKNINSRKALKEKSYIQKMHDINHFHLYPPRYFLPIYDSSYAIEESEFIIIEKPTL